MCVSVYLSREIYFKELAHVIMDVWQVQNLQGGLAGRDPGKNCSSSAKPSAGRISSLGNLNLSLLRPATG